MKFVFIHSDKSREIALAKAVVAGAKTHGMEACAVHLADRDASADADIIGFFGVKSVGLRDAAIKRGQHWLFFDKGYGRSTRRSDTEFWRVSLDEHNPIWFVSDLSSSWSGERAQRCGLARLPLAWDPNGHSIFAGASEKNHAWYGLPDPNAYAQEQIINLQGQYRCEIVYRPKPSWKGARPIDGTRLSTKGKLDDLLEGARLLVTHNSAAGLDAVVRGVPVIALGPTVARPVALATSLEKKLQVIVPPKQTAVDALLANIAHCQWTLEEYAGGEAWAVLLYQLSRIVEDMA